MTVPRYETTVIGKAMFGRGRIAFEVQQLDFSPEALQRVLKHERDFIGTSLATHRARDVVPVSSMQVKFADVMSIEQMGDVVKMQLSKPMCCYRSTQGKNEQVTEDITGGAKTLQFRVLPPPKQDQHQPRQKPKVAFHIVQEALANCSPHLQALFRGESAPEVPLVTPKKKRPASQTPAGISKRLRVEARGSGAAASAAERTAVDAEAVKQELNAHVQSLAQHRPYWHDSYEETGEELQQWFETCGERVNSVLCVGVKGGKEFGNCHELLKHVADTWSNILAIPFRGCPREDISAGEGVEVGSNTVSCPEELVDLVWPLLLARAATDASIPESLLLQMIQDAVVHGVDAPHKAAEAEPQLELSAAVRRQIQHGRARLVVLHGSAAWQEMPSTKKKHRMRRCIDRRFDGPKHLRTRDFGSSDEEDGDGKCSLM